MKRYILSTSLLAVFHIVLLISCGDRNTTDTDQNEKGELDIATIERVL